MTDFPEAAPPRATTPRKFRDLVEETMTPESIARAAERTKEQLRAAAFGTTEYAVPGGIYGQLDAAKAYIALLEADLLAPSRESGALQSGPWRQEIVANALSAIPSNCNWPRHILASAIEARDREIATLERDAARMREAATAFLDRYVQTVASGDWGNWNPEEEPEVIALRRALSPSGEPTATPEMSE